MLGEVGWIDDFVLYVGDVIGVLIGMWFDIVVLFFVEGKMFKFVMVICVGKVD